MGCQIEMTVLDILKLALQTPKLQDTCTTMTTIPAPYLQTNDENESMER
jgi:hypothetical protein